MRLTEPTIDHIKELMTWFTSNEQIEEWAGPNFEYPYDLKSFTRDLKLDSLDSFTLIKGKFEIVAFGQCYRRLQSCHVGRLAVAPKHRGKRVVAELIKQLVSFGNRKFDTSSSSLFVMEENTAAISAYRKLGFEFAPYPEAIPFENCLYMLKGT